MQKLRSIFRLDLTFTLSLVIVLAAAQAQANIISYYSSRTDFNLAFSNPKGENWDEFPINCIIQNGATINNITYNYVPDTSFSPALTFNYFQVTTNFLASTGKNTLGMSGSYTYFTSDGIKFVFQDKPWVFAIDISTLAPDDGTFKATTDLGQVALSHRDPFPGYDTGQFIGFASDVGISSVTITYNLDGLHYGHDSDGYYAYGWTLDTMVPLPSTLLLLGSGLAGLGLWRGRKLFKKA